MRLYLTVIQKLPRLPLLLLPFFLIQNGALAGGGKVSPAKSQTSASGRQYDAQGRYAGRVDQSGNRFDSQGRYLGRTDSSGRQYDTQGRFLGRADSSGRLYDSQGRYQGKIDAEGRQFDTQGRYTGRLAVTNVPAALSNPSTPSTLVKPEGGKPSDGPSAVTRSVEGSSAVAPFVFCNYGDKNCEN